MGHSMGALVALDAAAAWPERVAGLILVNGGARLPVAPEVFVKLTGDFARFGKWLSRRRLVAGDAARRRRALGRASPSPPSRR